MKKLTAVVVGFGGRGAIYASYAMSHPKELDIVGVAEPNSIRRETARKRHNISAERLYSTWEELAAQPRMADFAIIATQDNMHYAPALALIEKGYHLLLEKPMSNQEAQCRMIARWQIISRCRWPK